MNPFPKVIAELIIQYAGDLSLDLSIINPDCKQVSQVLISSNSKFALIYYVMPSQIVLINLHTQKVRKKNIGDIIQLKLISVLDNGDFRVFHVQLNLDVFLTKYNSKCKQIANTELPRYTSLTDWSERYLICDRNIQYIDYDDSVHQMALPSFPIITCNSQYVVFNSSDDVLIYSLSASQRVTKIKFGAQKFPPLVKMFDRYLITISHFNEMRLYDSSIKFANTLSEKISIPIKITILEMQDSNQIIFGNPNKGLYSMYLNDIKNITRIPIENLFAGLAMNNQMMITFGPGANVAKYGSAKNLKLFRKLSKDKFDSQMTTIIV